MTSIYWNKTQNLKDALKYRDSSIPGNTPDKYTAETVNYMPNYFRYLYWIPILVTLIILFSYHMHVHPLIWGVLIAFIGSLPSYYLLSNEIPLYCNQSWSYTRSFEQIKKYFDVNDVSKFANLRAFDNLTNQKFYFNFK